MRKKIEAWLESLPEEIRGTLEKDVIITGGSIASMLRGEDVNDFDLYLRTKEGAKVAADHYVERFLKFHPDCTIEPEVRVEGDRVRINIQSAGVASEEGDQDYQYFENTPGDEAATEFLGKVLPEVEQEQEKEKPKDPDPFRPRYLSENAISLSDKVQIVIRFWGRLDQIHQNYDFEHCKCGYDYAADLFHFPETALLSLMSRTLRYTGSLYPVCSLFRARKFIARGWNISAGEILKIAMQVSALDLTDVNVLREQLVGVDMAYFFELLRVIEEEKEKREGKPLDSTYLAILIDRIFNT